MAHWACRTIRRSPTGIVMSGPHGSMMVQTRSTSLLSPVEFLRTTRIQHMMADDTIEVRPDERLDEARLTAYLRDRLVGADAPLNVRQFGGGAANLTYLLDFGERQYVLRRPPLGPVAPSAHDMGREWNVLSVLYQAFPLAPRAFHFCPDPTVVGAPFFI